MNQARARQTETSAKSRQAFRTISEVSAELNLPQHVLRFWESRFSQVRPMKRGGGRRLYRPDHIALLRGIRALLYDDGLSIKAVQQYFRDHGIKTVVARGARDAATHERAAHEVAGDIHARLAALAERLSARAGPLPAPAPAPSPDAASARLAGSIQRLERVLAKLENA
ncbi:MAG: MerR family transcriptional regulator [Pseudomonadota bacterium]